MFGSNHHVLTAWPTYLSQHSRYAGRPGELFNNGTITITFFFVSYLFLIRDGGAVVRVSAVAVILGRFELDFSDGELLAAEAGRVFLTVGAIPAVAANRASFSYTCSGA